METPHSPTPTDRDARLAQSCQQSRRELWFMLGAWVFFCAWVLIAAAFSAYRIEGREAPLVLGLPAWVVWGIMLPWVSALVVTLWFAGWGMRDTPLDQDADSEEQDSGKPEERYSTSKPEINGSPPG